MPRSDCSAATAKGLRFDSLQAFRGFAALAVVYHHLYVIAPRFLGFDYNGPWAISGDLGVYFFFALSGFIITWIHLTDIGYSGRFLPFVRKRVTRIYPMVWILVAVKVVSLALIPALAVTSKSDPPTVAASLLLIPHSQYVIDVQWTLVHEVIFYAIFAGWILAGRRVAVVSTCWWLAAILLAPSSWQQGNIFLKFLLSGQNLEFLGGALVAISFTKFQLSSRPAAMLAVTSLICVVWGVATDIRTHAWWTPVFCSLLLALISLDACRRLRWPAWITYLGDASYSIYLIHTSLQMVIVVVGKKAGLAFASHGQLLLHIAGFLSLLGGIACYRWVELPVTMWLKRFPRKPAGLAPAS